MFEKIWKIILDMVYPQNLDVGKNAVIVRSGLSVIFLNFAARILWEFAVEGGDS